MSNYSEPISILLIEDDPEDAFLVKKNLNCNKNCKIEHFTTISEVVDHSDRVDATVILLDLNLPDSNGVSTIKTINRILPNIPIVVLTGSDDEETSMSVLDYGGSDYLSKREINKTNLRRIVLFTIERDKLNKELIEREVKLKELYEELQQKNKLLAELSIKDPLTNLYNRRYIDETLKKEISQISRTKNNLFYIIMDIDRFKDINDTFGHDAGDFILVQISKILKINMRDTDVCGRFGGDEFIIYGLYKEEVDFLLLAKRIHENILNSTFKYNDHIIDVTASVGVSSLNIDALEDKQLLLDADKALYKAKETGRNKVVGYINSKIMQ